jgi:hypothetical protein
MAIGGAQSDGIADDPANRTLSAASLAIAVAAGLFGLGTLVANLYLLAYGASDFSLVRPRAIFTGLLVVAPAIITFGLPLFFFDRPARKVAGEKSRRISKGAAALLVNFDWVQSWIGALAFQLLPFLYYVTVVALVPGRTGPVTPISAANVLAIGFLLWATGLIGVLGSLLSGLSFLGLSDRFLDALGQTRRDRTPITIRSRVQAIGLSCVLVATHIALFVANVYPSVPRAIGGARPQEVQLILSPEQTGANEAGLAPELGEKQVLIEAGEGYYLVELADGRVVQVNSDIVSAVVVR